MDIANNYPVFEADQVLSKEHLNNLFNYLDQQSRLTRCKLIGSGIVCGLEITYNQQSIHISKGSALTSQGLMMLLCEDDYTHYMPYASPVFPEHFEFIQTCGKAGNSAIPFYKPGFENDELLQLIPAAAFNKMDAEEKQAATLLSSVATDKLDKYAVVLFLETEELNLKNCDTNDCNDKGSRMDFDTKVLLVKKTILNEIRKKAQDDSTISGTADAAMQHIELMRYNVPVNNLKSADEVLSAFISLVDDSFLKRLSQVLSDCYTHYKSLLDDEVQNPFLDLFQTLRQEREKIIKDSPVLIQYFYDFIDDLVKAYHEFRHKMKDTLSECCGDEMRFPFHIMLGDATVNTDSSQQNTYRQYFIYSALFDSQKQRLAEIRSLFKRMKLMLEEFSIADLTNFQRRTVSITPSRYGNAALSKRCIPYYYNVAEQGKELYRSWSYPKTSRGNARFNLSYHAAQYSTEETVVTPLLFDLEPFNFFRVEGHIGKNLNDALIKVKTIQQDYNLPFETIALSADFIGTLLKGQEPHCVIQDLESDYRVLIAEFVCRLHDSFCLASGVSYRTIATFASVLAPLTLAGSALRTSAATTAATASAASSAGSAASLATGAATVLSDDEDEDKIVLKAINNIAVAADHIYVAALVNEFHATKKYQKGDTLARLCNPVKGSLGFTYISIIKSNKGSFKNPVAFRGLVPISVLYFEMFEFIDRVESMFQILMSNDLAELNVDEFKAAFKKFEAQAKNLKKASQRFMNEVQLVLDACIVERLEALKLEYSRRTDQYRLAKNFSYYFKKHGGIEHKAGVPRGGTFILVYHEKRNQRLIDPRSLFLNKNLSTLLLSHFQTLLKPAVKINHLEFQSKLLQTATLFKEPELYMRFKDVMHKYLDECHDLPEDRRKDILAIINRPPERKEFELTDGMVIADFYVPYLCCSDCPPVAYILPSPSKDETADPTIRIAKTSMCNADETAFAISFTPADADISGDGVHRTADGKYVFKPFGLPAGLYTVFCKANGKTATEKVEVTATPKTKFSLRTTVAQELMTVFFSNESTDTNAQTTFTWLLDGVKFSEKKDPEPISFKVASLPHTITLKASNGPCPAEFSEVIKKEIIESRKISVCSNIKILKLQPILPLGAVIKILNDGGILKEDLSISPAALKLSKTATFNVSYSINGNQVDVAITVMVANADFTMTIGLTAATRQSGIILSLASIDKNHNTNEWKILPLPIAGANIVLTDDPLKNVQLSLAAIRELKKITIEHIVSVKSGDTSCIGTETYELLFEHLEKALDKKTFDNHFKF